MKDTFLFKSRNIWRPNSSQQPAQITIQQTFDYYLNIQHYIFFILSQSLP